MNNRFRVSQSILLLLTCVCLPKQSHALDQIIRPYQSTRIAGMGGVRMTTGLYDENFFNNPARVTANPESKFTVLDIMPFEITPATLKAGANILSGKDALNTISSSAGTNIHDRLQVVLPAYYRAPNEDRDYGLAIGLIMSTQVDADLRQNNQINVTGVSDVGLAVTYGRRFLENKNLSVGATAHLIYRLGANPNYTLLDYIQGTSLGLSTIGGGGSMFDFDLGSTYKITEWGAFGISVGGAIQNVLGGSYSNLKFNPLPTNGPALPQPRSYGLGVSMDRPEWGPFTNTTFALEVTDIANSPGGSFFKLLHLGAETHWKSFAIRAGINQGYLTAGVGLDVHYFSLNLATYGEEMGLNAGTLEDRRYVASIGFHI